MPRLHTSCAQDSSLTHARPTRTHTDTGAHTAGGTHVLLHPSHSFSSFDSRHPSAGMLDAKLGHSPDGVRHRSVFVSAPAGLQVALGARQAELRDCKRGCHVSQTRAAGKALARACCVTHTRPTNEQPRCAAIPPKKSRVGCRTGISQNSSKKCPKTD